MRSRRVLAGIGALAFVAGTLALAATGAVSTAAGDITTTIYTGADPLTDPYAPQRPNAVSRDGAVVMVEVDNTNIDVINTRLGTVTEVAVPSLVNGEWELSSDGGFLVHAPAGISCDAPDEPGTRTVTVVRVADGRVQSRDFRFGVSIVGDFAVEFAPPIAGCSPPTGPFDVARLDDLGITRTIGDSATTWRSPFDGTSSAATASPTLFVSPADDRGIVERLQATTVQWIDLADGNVIRSLTSLTGDPFVRSGWTGGAVAYGEVASDSPTSARVRVVSTTGVSPAIDVPVTNVAGTPIGDTWSTVIADTLYVTRIGDSSSSSYQIPIVGITTSLGAVPDRDAVVVEHLEATGRSFRRVPLDGGAQDVLDHPRTFTDIPSPSRALVTDTPGRLAISNFDPQTLLLDFERAEIVALAGGTATRVLNGDWLEIGRADGSAELTSLNGAGTYVLGDHVSSCAGSLCSAAGFFWADDSGYASYYATSSQFIIERVDFAPTTTTTTTTATSTTTTTTLVAGPSASVSVLDDTATLSGPDLTTRVDVLANDTVRDGTLDPATLTVTRGPSVGAATVRAGGTIEFGAPFGAGAGTVSFDYRVCVRGDTVCGTATVVVTIGRRFVEAGGSPGFDDVPPGKFYSTPVAWMVANDITTGTSATTFSPNKCVTRGELATFVFRLVQPTSTATSTPFVDVPADVFYSLPVAWMVAENLTTGTSPTTFSPNRCVTRGELATFFLRLAGVEWTATATPFTDVDPDAFYAAPVAWMVAEDITRGTSATTFSPNDPVTRAQFATFTFRLATGTTWRP